ncbi:winged helix-turn-helix transcriptional regulator [Emticicia sp. CRIBPO]|nr:winged helix-turn-helix transcriptional regulator [Emticicia sp. CRIBPO]
MYKVVYAEIPLRVEYKLTEIGKSLIPVISSLGQWADEHEDHLREVIMKR